jgi:hypothetical protein
VVHRGVRAERRGSGGVWQADAEEALGSSDGEDRARFFPATPRAIPTLLPAIRRNPATSRENANTVCDFPRRPESADAVCEIHGTWRGPVPRTAVCFHRAASESPPGLVPPQSPCCPYPTPRPADSTRSRLRRTAGVSVSSNASSTAPCTSGSRSAATSTRSAVWPPRDRSSKRRRTSSRIRWCWSSSAWRRRRPTPRAIWRPRSSTGSSACRRRRPRGRRSRLPEICFDYPNHYPRNGAGYPDHCPQNRLGETPGSLGRRPSDDSETACRARGPHAGWNQVPHAPPEGIRGDCSCRIAASRPLAGSRTRNFWFSRQATGKQPDLADTTRKQPEPPDAGRERDPGLDPRGFG